MNNLIVIDKPIGLTSHDVVARIRKVTGVKRVGHAGTLDPMASGVLVVGIGREATKQLGGIMKTHKEYQATITLGADSSTDDAEGELTPHPQVKQPPLPLVTETLSRFIGEIDQTPPPYSAIKINGKAAYVYARQGNEVRLPSRKVHVYDITLISYAWPHLEVVVKCGSGVYIRSLARDIGSLLSTGGYLSFLRRTKVGIYDITQALSLELFPAWWQRQMAV